MTSQHMQPGDLCLVTGMTGYVASWIGKDLLEAGYLCLSVKGRNVDLAIAIRDNYATRGFSPSTRTYPKFLLWIVKFFSADVASIYPLLGKETLRETNYLEVYHYRYTDFAQMVRDTMDDLLEKKAIQAK
jgi:dihydroflavonol-4-reductase